MMTKSKVPQIRFKGFTDEWEEEIIAKIGTFFSGGTPTSTNRSYYNGSIPFIGSGKINSNEVEQYITIEALNNSSAKMIEIGDLLYALYGATSGEVAISKIKGAINQAVLCIRTDKNKTFLYTWFLKNKKNILSTYLQGGQGNLSAQIVKSLEIYLPLTTEQTRIGNYFQQLDNLIEQKEKKYQKLKQFKKAMLDKMFPKNGANTPEIRFKGFSGKWEEKSLGDIGQFKSGTGFSEKEQGGKKGVPFFKVSDMNLSNNKSFMNEANNYVSQQQIERMQYKPINELSIIFAKVGAAIFLERKRIAKNFLLDNNMMAFSPNVDIFFLFHWFIRIKLSKFTQVGALPSYNANDLKIIEISLPSQDEQKKIGNYFQKLDKQIDLLQKELEKLKNIKKASLAKMFV